MYMVLRAELCAGGLECGGGGGAAPRSPGCPSCLPNLAKWAATGSTAPANSRKTKPSLAPGIKDHYPPIYCYHDPFLIVDRTYYKLCQIDLDKNEGNLSTEANI